MTREKRIQTKEEKIIMTVSKNSMMVNIALSVMKLIAGVIAHSGAMISDAVHSASDVFSTIVVMVGYRMSSKEADEDHQYGHERLECVAAVVLACVLFFTGVGIGMTGIKKILSNDYSGLAIPGVLALIAAAVSIVVKEGMYWYTLLAAKKVNSTALRADAWHHRSDALSSIGSLVGIAGARLGAPVCDPLASVIIALFIVKAAFEIFKDAIDKMTDKACDWETQTYIKKYIMSVDGVIMIDRLQTRQFGSKIYVDVEIVVDGNLSLRQAHDIAEQVHCKVEEEYPDVKHCTTHVNPFEEKNK